MERPRVVVHGEDIFKGPILDTDTAKVVEFYDCNGELVAMFGKVLSDDFWSFSTKSDEDWPDVLARMGYLTGAPSYQQTVSRLVAP